MLDWKMVGRVAQVVEQRPFKAWVAGSNPAALTNSYELRAMSGEQPEHCVLKACSADSKGPVIRPNDIHPL